MGALVRPGVVGCMTAETTGSAINRCGPAPSSDSGDLWTRSALGVAEGDLLPLVTVRTAVIELAATVFFVSDPEPSSVGTRDEPRVGRE